MNGHLDLEALARLADDTPSMAESAHLTACQLCRTELDAMRAQSEALAGLADRAAPKGGWMRLSAALHRDGQLRGGLTPWWSSAPLRVAAAVGLFLLGASAGMLATAAATPPGGGATAAAETSATEGLEEAEARYLEALARFRESAGATAEGDPTARLVALESIVQATGVALRQAPADPVINGYHLSARGQRDEALRDLARLTSNEWYR